MPPPRRAVCSLSPRWSNSGVSGPWQPRSVAANCWRRLNEPTPARFGTDDFSVLAYFKDLDLQAQTAPRLEGLQQQILPDGASVLKDLSIALSFDFFE